MEEKKLQNQIVSALIHFLYNFFVYFPFLVPFDLWRKATFRLAEQREQGTINITKITGLWPFLSFLKAFFLEFLIDGAIFMSYVLAIIIAIVYSIIWEDFSIFFKVIILSYFSPIGWSLVRDIIQLFFISPIKKFISWLKKPAQYMDLEIKNK